MGGLGMKLRDKRDVSKISTNHFPISLTSANKNNVEILEKINMIKWCHTIPYWYECWIRF